MFGGTVDFYFTKNIGVGLFVKGFFLDYSTLYTDWDSAHSGGGGAISLQNSSSPHAGFFTHIGIQLSLRVGD